MNGRYFTDGIVLNLSSRNKAIESCGDYTCLCSFTAVALVSENEIALPYIQLMGNVTVIVKESRKLQVFNLLNYNELAISSVTV